MQCPRMAGVVTPGGRGLRTPAMSAMLRGDPGSPAACLEEEDQAEGRSAQRASHLQDKPRRAGGTPTALATISSHRHRDSELSVLTSPFTGEETWRESPQEAGEGFRVGWVILPHCGHCVLIL